MAAVTEGFVVVRIAGAMRLIELARVREIVPAMLLSTPDGVEGACRGVANVRGELFPVFDVARREGPLDPSQLIVIARAEEEARLGILVDDVVDIVELERSAVLTHATGGGRTMRTTHLAGEVVSVLATDEVVHA